MDIREAYFLYALSLRAMIKAEAGEFKSEVESFEWIENERNKSGYSYSYEERVRALHLAEQTDAERNFRNSNESKN